MSLATLMSRTVTIVTPGVRVDAYSDNQPDWTTATSVATVGWLAQTSTLEDLDGRNATSSLFSLTLPAGTAIFNKDRVVIDGVTYEVDGSPTSAHTPAGEHHLEVPLKVVAG